MPYVPCVPAWSTCLCAKVAINVPTCQRCANYSTRPTNVPTACQILNFACQRAKWRAKWRTKWRIKWRANVPKGVLNFQKFDLRNAKGNFYTLLLYKKFYIILDIIVLYIWSVYVPCIKIVLYFISILHVILKKNVRNFCFFGTFLSFS